MFIALTFFRTSGFDLWKTQECFKILPYAFGIIFLFFLCFGMWVRTVEPKVTMKPMKENAPSGTENMGQSTWADEPIAPVVDDANGARAAAGMGEGGTTEL